MKSKLPDISDLYSDEFGTGTLFSLLNQPVNISLTKDHPEFPGFKYLPIEKVNFLVRKIFKTNQRTEVLREGIFSGSVFVTVRCHYFDIDISDWNYVDGIAGCEIVGRGVKAALPIAKSDAIKDAWGIFPLFGSELNKDKSLNLTQIPFDKKWDEVDKLFESVFNQLKPEDIEPLQELIKSRDNSKRVMIIQKLRRLSKFKTEKTKLP